MILPTRRNALALLGLGLSATAATARDMAADARDLTVEPERPAHRPVAHPARRQVQVSLMPVGPSTLVIGEPMRFRMVSLADGFGHLYVLSASGRTQLWLENIPLRAGEPLRYPLRGQIVRATAPTGEETLIFAASRQPIDGFTGHGATSTAVDLPLTHEALRAAIADRFAGMARGDRAFAEIRVHVRA